MLSMKFKRPCYLCFTFRRYIEVHGRPTTAVFRSKPHQVTFKRQYLNLTFHIYFPHLKSRATEWARIRLNWLGVLRVSATSKNTDYSIGKSSPITPWVFSAAHFMKNHCRHWFFHVEKRPQEPFPKSNTHFLPCQFFCPYAGMFRCSSKTFCLFLFKRLLLCVN